MSDLGGDDQAPLLELAYAVTVHKSQGSEFGQTFVIVPNPCRLLSRELLYTALTRQRDHLVAAGPGPLADLADCQRYRISETAARLTNLFTAPSGRIDGRYLEAGLIHRTRKGIAVRSKSEVIIADCCTQATSTTSTSSRSICADSSRRLPDFTIATTPLAPRTTGSTSACSSARLTGENGRRSSPGAITRILPHDEGGGPNGVLITTQDGDDGSISSAQIEALIDRILA